MTLPLIPATSQRGMGPKALCLRAWPATHQCLAPPERNQCFRRNRPADVRPTRLTEGGASAPKPKPGTSGMADHPAAFAARTGPPIAAPGQLLRLLCRAYALTHALGLPNAMPLAGLGFT